MPAVDDSGGRLSQFELFVLALSILSLVNIAIILLPVSDGTRDVVVIVDGILCTVFLVDFALRLVRAPDRRRYLFPEHGWLDLVGSLPVPGLRLARVFRVMRVGRSVRARGVRGFVSDFKASAASGTLFLVAIFTVLVLEFGGMAVLAAERGSADANITTGGDALWWGVVTISTVGYGDRFPVSMWGRIVGVVVLGSGVALFSTFTGWLANAFLTPRRPVPVAVPVGSELATIASIRQVIEEQEASLGALRDHLDRLEAAARAASRSEPERGGETEQAPEVHDPGRG